jgi:hypothetical protein
MSKKGLKGKSHLCRTEDPTFVGKKIAVMAIKSRGKGQRDGETRGLGDNTATENE